MVHRNKASDCLREPLVDTLPTQCLQLKRGFGECRRGLVDMRKRFRGNLPVSYQKIQKADDQNAGYQLYAGKTAFSGGVKSTDGNEFEKDWREVENEKFRATQLAREEMEKKEAASKR